MKGCIEVIQSAYTQFITSILSHRLNTAIKEAHAYQICRDFCKNSAKSPRLYIVIPAILAGLN